MVVDKHASFSEALKPSVWAASWLTVNSLVIVSLLRLVLVEKDGSRRSLARLFDQYVFGVHPLAFFVLQFLVLFLGTSLVLRVWWWLIAALGVEHQNTIARGAFWWSMRRQFGSGWLLASGALVAVGFALSTFASSWLFLAWLALSIYLLPVVVARPRWMSPSAADRRYFPSAFVTTAFLLFSVIPVALGALWSLTERAMPSSVFRSIDWMLAISSWLLGALALTVLLFSPDRRTLCTHIKTRWNWSFLALVIVSELTALVRLAVVLFPPLAAVGGAMIFVIPSLVELHQRNLMGLPMAAFWIIRCLSWVADNWYLLLPGPYVLLYTLYQGRCLYVYERSVNVQAGIGTVS
jgi:small basic protein